MMTLEKLSEELKDKYDNAESKEKVAQIHLFGIKYGKQIKEMNLSVAEIIRQAGMKEAYKTELSKGVKLSDNVSLIEFKIMSIEDLSNILSDKYHNSNNDAVAQIHLFGINYGKHIRMNNFRVAEIIKLAGLSKTYITELDKGIKLSEFVKSKNQ